MVFLGSIMALGCFGGGGVLVMRLVLGLRKVAGDSWEPAALPNSTLDLATGGRPAKLVSLFGGSP